MARPASAEGLAYPIRSTRKRNRQQYSLDENMVLSHALGFFEDYKKAKNVLFFPTAMVVGTGKLRFVVMLLFFLTSQK